MFKIVAAARAEGVSVLLVEQNVRAAVEIADRAYVLDDGKVVYEGDAGGFGRDEQRVRELAGASAGEMGYGGLMRRARPRRDLSAAPRRRGSQTPASAAVLRGDGHRQRGLFGAASLVDARQIADLGDHAARRAATIR